MVQQQAWQLTRPGDTKGAAKDEMPNAARNRRSVTNAAHPSLIVETIIETLLHL